MKPHGLLNALLFTGVFGESLTDPADVSATLSGDEAPTIEKNHGGWVNPEDLMPMPQCIAQQDQSSWLRAMTKCTHHRCTSHFASICTHYQWLTQLSCLSAEFPPSVVKYYIKYCSRSILAKAQLYQWVQNTTGRTWLVDVGDSYGLQSLSSESLTKGYANIGIIDKAPACLRNSMSSSPRESFQHVMASCSFTATTLHTGNTARPWEYNPERRSMTALSFDTAGYDLTNSHVPPGEYIDKACFCSTFTMDQYEEPCSTSGLSELTVQRQWLNDTCGYIWRDRFGRQPRDMVPWKWIVSPASKDQIAKCPSNEWKLKSIAYVNLATLFTVLYANGQRDRGTTTSLSQQPSSLRWILGGLLLASFHILANLVNAYIIQNTPGYESVPVLQLTLLWCSLPRLSWLPFSRGHPDSTSARSSLVAEVVLHGLSLYYMCLAVKYGRQHGFYRSGNTAGGGTQELLAGLIYIAALLWLLVVATMVLPVLRSIWNIFKAAIPASKTKDGFETENDTKTNDDATERLLPESRHEPSTNHQDLDYGTMPPDNEALEPPRGFITRLYIDVPVELSILWHLQWLFWVGYICVSSDDFCLPSLEILTAIWVASSVGSVVMKSYL